MPMEKNAAVLLLGEQRPLLWLKRALEQEGYDVSLYQPALVETPWSALLYQARNRYCDLRAHYERVYLLGQSDGAMLALLLAQQYLPDGLICLSAPLRLKPGAFVRALLSSVKADALFLRAAPRKRKWGLFRLCRLARENLYAVGCKTLVVQSAGDPYLSPAAAQMILSNCRAEEKQRLLLRNSGHLVSLGPEKALLLSAILAFLRPHS